MDLQLLLVDGCPHAGLARERLADAIAQIGIEASIDERIVGTTAEAEDIDFSGSPTILVDGRDPFPTSTSAGLSCRLYPTATGSDGAPAVEDLVAALRRASGAPGARGPLDSPPGDPSAGLRWAAFDRLLEGAPVAPDQLAEALDVSRPAVDEMVSAAARGGLVDIDDGQVVGANGLTLRTTPHRLDMRGRTFHTWCSLDAIGIPAALGVDATVSSGTQREGAVVVRLVGGEPEDATGLVVWLPEGPCGDLRRDFCDAANLFPDPAALERWLADNGRPQGRAITVDEAAELGRSWWGRRVADGCCDAPC